MPLALLIYAHRTGVFIIDICYYFCHIPIRPSSAVLRKEGTVARTLSSPFFMLILHIEHVNSSSVAVADVGVRLTIDIDCQRRYAPAPSFRYC